MVKRTLSEDEIIEAACYFVLPYRSPKEKLESMFQKIVVAARENGLDLSPEYYASQSEEHLRKLTINAYIATSYYSRPMKWSGDDGVINKLKPLSYEDKLHVLFALHEFYCIRAERGTRYDGCNLVGTRHDETVGIFHA